MDSQNYSKRWEGENRGSIRYFTVDGCSKLKMNECTTDWLHSVARTEGSRIKQLYYVFCNDDYLLPMNRKYLQHDTLTDVLTFDYRSNKGSPIEGEVYISTERVEENAQIYGVGFKVELARVMVHGLLHLIGYQDSDRSQQKKMREKENKYLANRMIESWTFS